MFGTMKIEDRVAYLRLLIEERKLQAELNQYAPVSSIRYKVTCPHCRQSQAILIDGKYFNTSTIVVGDKDFG